MEDLSGSTGLALGGVGTSSWLQRGDFSALGLYPDTLKALTTVGSDRTRSTHPMIGESLDDIVKVLTARAPYHTPILNRLRSKRAFSTVEEFNRLTGLGDEGSFMTEGDLPREATSVYERALGHVRFMGQTGVITGPMMAAARAKFGNMKAKELVNRTNRILLDTETAILWGDSTAIPVSFDGIFKQFAAGSYATDATNLIDLRGEPIDLYYVGDGCQRIWDRHGEASLVCLSSRDKGYVNRLQDPHRRYTGEGTTNVTPGIVVGKFHSDFGDVDMLYDKFLAPPRLPRTSAGDCETSAPVQPTTTVAAALITDADTRLPIGDYQYSAAGINKYGEGVEKALAGAITVTTGKSVRVTIPDEAGNTTATAYRIYRAVGAGQRYYLGMTGARASGADTTFDDNNDFIAGCTRGLILDERALTLAYLLRPTTFDLAKIADTERFMMVQYIGLLLYAARWVVELRNIGTPPTPSS